MTKICPENITVYKVLVFKHRVFHDKTCNLFLGFERLKNGAVARWKATGNSIPFPVYHGTWFTGLSIKYMTAFMSDYGYELVSTTKLGSLPTREALIESKTR